MFRKSFFKWAAVAVLVLPVVPAIAATKTTAKAPAKTTAKPVALTATAKTSTAKKSTGKVVHHRAPQHKSQVSKKHRAIHRKVATNSSKKSTTNTKTALASNKWAPPALEMPKNRLAGRTSPAPAPAPTVIASNRKPVTGNTAMLSAKSTTPIKK